MTSHSDSVVGVNTIRPILITVSKREDTRKEAILKAYEKLDPVPAEDANRMWSDMQSAETFVDSLDENKPEDCAKLLRDSLITIGVLDKQRLIDMYGPTLAYNEWFVDSDAITCNIPEGH